MMPCYKVTMVENGFIVEALTPSYGGMKVFRTFEEVVKFLKLVFAVNE